MANYVVTARIGPVRPRLASRDDPRPASRNRTLDEARIEAIDLPQPASERWARLRELWAQTTFYLFDPESWR